MKSNKGKKTKGISDLYSQEKFFLKTAKNPKSDLTKLESGKKRITPVITNGNTRKNGRSSQ